MLAPGLRGTALLMWPTDAHRNIGPKLQWDGELGLCDGQQVIIPSQGGLELLPGRRQERQAGRTALLLAPSSKHPLARAHVEDVRVGLPRPEQRGGWLKEDVASPTLRRGRGGGGGEGGQKVMLRS